MSEDNADLTTALTEFTNDFNKFAELVTTVNTYEQKFQKHINELNKHQELQSLDDLIKNVFKHWVPLKESVESVQKDLGNIETSNNTKVLKRTETNKNNKVRTNEPSTETVGPKKIIETETKETAEKEKVSLEAITKEEINEQEEVVLDEEVVVGLTEEVVTEEKREEVVSQSEQIEEIVPESVEEVIPETTVSDKPAEEVVVAEPHENEQSELVEEENSGKVVSESVEKSVSESPIVEANSKVDENTVTEHNEIEQKPKIRLVPLQNLLSKVPKANPLFHVTISDSDDDDSIVVVPSTRATSAQQQAQQIYELSDSDEAVENPESRKLKEPENGLSKQVKSSSEKHIRIKYTPIRKPNELALQREKRKRTQISSDEDTVTKPETAGKINATITTTTCNDSEKHTEIEDNSASSEEARTCSPVISAALSQKETVRTTTANVAGFSKTCVVRLKREPLPTACEAKSDALKKSSKSRRGSGSGSLSSLSKETNRKMASDSESDVEVLPDNSNSEDNSNSSSDSEVVAPRKKRMFEQKPKSSSASSDSEENDTGKAGKAPARKKRKVVRKSTSSSDDGSDGSDLDNSDKNKKRKKIRKLINERNLDDDTKRATREEEERKRRIEERQKMYNQIYVKQENVEIEELILDFDEETKKPLLKVDNGLLKRLKPHQVHGVKFIWDACFETVKDCRENPGSGCILAHCMGLGKTMQIVALTHTLLTNSDVTSFERVLIISPLSTLNNWAREFHHWMSFAKNKDIEVYDMSKYKDKNMRAFKLEEWFTEGGVCIIGYDMYRILSNEKTKGLRKKQKEMLQRSLVDPGPDVVICDEGHLLKNEKTSLSKAVTRMRTKRRIVLTGTPLQNNLKEYYCMIQFIKPNLLGTYKEYLNRFVNPISNGQYTDSTERDIRLMKHRSHVLHKMLEACLQRRDYLVLAPYLPPKYEYVVFVTLSEMQKQLYGHYMTTQRDLIGEASGNPGKGAKLFQDFQDLRRIWTHPMNLRVNSDTVIRKKLARYDSDDSIKDFIDDDNTEESSSSESDNTSSGEAEVTEVKTVRTRNTRSNRDISYDSDCVETQAKDDPSEWWTKFVDEAELNNIHHSPKLVVLMTLLQRCEEIGDKVLVFSQSLQSLDVIEHFLSLIDRKTRGEEIEGDVGEFKGRWRPGVNYFRLDGSRTVENRETMCKSFNDRSNLNARLFLISTRAGGLGINLVAANRVVIFDVSWNPSHDTQSIFRVYRFGQTKPCYIYRLIALGTMEQKVYERQVAKQATAKRVIDEQQISRHYNQNDLQELYTYELEPSTPREIPILPKDRLFAELLSNHEKLLFKYHEHDSLLENEDSENLSEEERKAAWSEYEAEKTRPPQPAMQFMGYDRGVYMQNYGNPAGTVTSNKIFGFRSDILLRLLNMKGCQDHPELTGSQVIQLVPEYLQRLYFEMNNGDPTLYKELLELHKSLETPGGMYTNPLLFANQNPPNPIVPPLATQMRPYGQIHPGTSNFNSNEVYEVD